MIDVAPSGVVSLLDMLRFYADKFVRLAREIQTLHTEFQHELHSAEASEPVPVDLLPSGIEHIHRLRDECSGALLTSAVDQVDRMLKSLKKGTSARNFVGLMHELQNRIDDELTRKIIYYVESDRVTFCDPGWLVDSPIVASFPTAFKEIQSAGRCYAFGEAPASAFHSMRALEVALGALASHFGVDFQSTNWHPVIEKIESAIRDISKAQKSQQRLDDEKFFGGLGRHFMFLKNGWRNHVMHVREQYGDREARQMLDHVSDLITEMCPRLSE